MVTSPSLPHLSRTASTSRTLASHVLLHSLAVMRWRKRARKHSQSKGDLTMSGLWYNLIAAMYWRRLGGLWMWLYMRRITSRIGD
jgi:hypothetical protein